VRDRQVRDRELAKVIPHEEDPCRRRQVRDRELALVFCLERIIMERHSDIAAF
jgi:hypothetical protein